MGVNYRCKNVYNNNPDVQQPTICERKDGIYWNTPKMTENFTHQLIELTKKKSKTMLEKFVLLVSQLSWTNSTFISHNGNVSHSVSKITKKIYIKNITLFPNHTP